jgi:hypothetical protein
MALLWPIHQVSRRWPVVCNLVNVDEDFIAQQMDWPCVGPMDSIDGYLVDEVPSGVRAAWQLF